MCIFNNTLDKEKQWNDEHKEYRMGITFGGGRKGMNYQVQVIIKALSYGLSEGLNAITFLNEN